MIGRLQRLPLRQVWRYEALNFSVWLEENIDLLQEELGLNLTLVGREQSAGEFRVDLLAKDDEGKMVVIENQLEWSDHFHLGQLLTYLAAFDAHMAIWIAQGARLEHVEAINWLNQNSEGTFYLLKLEAVQIDDSPPAPLLTLIVGPSEESRAIRERKKDLIEEQELVRDFWRGLQNAAKDKTSLHTKVLPYKDYWLRDSTGIEGVYFYYAINPDTARLELYMQSDDQDRNHWIFDQLYEVKSDVEQNLGRLQWRSQKNWAVCKIVMPATTKGYRSREDWPDIHESLVDAMVRFEKAFRPHLERLRSASSDAHPQ